MKFPWHRKRRETQLNEELRAHLEMSTQERISRADWMAASAPSSE